MWNNFWAVVVDLFWFAFGIHSKNEIVVYGSDTMSALPPGATRQALHGRPTPVFISEAKTPILLPLITSTATAHSTLPVIETEPMQSSTILHAPVVMYVQAPTGTACIESPHLDFDTVIESLPYGAAVTVIGYLGRYASVNRSNITGWVLKDDITPQKNDVWPALVSGMTYDAENMLTQKTRLLINDMFGAGALALPLQAGEYIALRLKSEHRSIVWSRKRPRVAGNWAKLLRGTQNIHIGVNPKTDSIMEWTNSDGEGRLGYVEAVAPDLAITISAVGTEESGRYTVKTMSEEIWRELRPVFIEVA